jgi:hypothetical protein
VGQRWIASWGKNTYACFSQSLELVASVSVGISNQISLPGNVRVIRVAIVIPLDLISFQHDQLILSVTGESQQAGKDDPVRVAKICQG